MVFRNLYMLISQRDMRNKVWYFVTYLDKFMVNTSYFLLQLGLTMQVKGTN